MRTIETSDWVILNDIIYDIYTMEDFSDMQFHFLEHMQMILDFDAAVFSLPSREALTAINSFTTLHCDPDLIRKYQSLDYRHGIMYSGKSMVFRDTDIISDEKRLQSEYYRSVYIPNKWSFALQMTLAKSGNFLGAVTFYRRSGKPDFAYFDIFILNMLKDHLSYRLETQLSKEQSGDSRLSLEKAADTYSLTKREVTILELLLKGEETDAICQTLLISPNTLKKHILNIYRKLGINSRSQIFRMIREPH